MDADLRGQIVATCVQNFAAEFAQLQQANPKIGTDIALVGKHIADALVRYEQALGALLRNAIIDEGLAAVRANPAALASYEAFAAAVEAFR